MPFDPNVHLIKLQGKDYLEVKYRIQWLRQQHPDAAIVTEILNHNPAEEWAVIRATVTIPGGGSATGMALQRPTKVAVDYIANGECVGLDVRILTRGGWRTYDQLTIGEEVLAYDHISDRCAWTPLEAVTVHEYRERVRFANASGQFDILVTPDHSWATAGTYRSWVNGESPRRMRKTTDLKTSDRIIRAAMGPDEAGPLTPDEAAILGWLSTDGMIWLGNGTLAAHIYQSKPKHLERIHELVGAVATHRTAQLESHWMVNHQWRLPAAFIRPLLEKANVASLEDLPRLATRLSSPARRAMLEAMLAADGDANRRIGKEQMPVLEAAGILAILEGDALGVQGRTSSGLPIVTIKQRRFLTVDKTTIEPAPPGPVWCPTTAFGTWVAQMPNGATTITGNTSAIGRALGALGFGTQFSYDFDQGEQVVDSPVERKAPPVTPLPDPELVAAKALLKTAVVGHGLTWPQVVDVAQRAWPHVTTVEDLGTLTAFQVRRLADVLLGESVIDSGGRIVPAAEQPTIVAELSEAMR